ncbi:hypothetical protein QQX98_009564 [Neonectria punicea]|uniref:Uncharacterized protein n=1 Tax=Neonectria punicea TaxID=979145 RepID=A0ABR1GRX9_9HYPO
MRTPYLVCSFVAAASLFSGTTAGPCKPSSSETYTVLSSTTEAASAVTTDVTSSTETASSTTSDVPSSTSSLPGVATFDLKGANSEVEAVNGQSLFYRQDNGYSLFLVVPESVTSYYGPGEFHLEEATNRLMVGDFHVFASSFSTTYALVTYLQTATFRPYSVFISCVPPTARGQKLECVVKGTSRSQFRVAETESTQGHSLYMYAPSVDERVDVDIIVS